jgi:hypothetical protein
MNYSADAFFGTVNSYQQNNGSPIALPSNTAGAHTHTLSGTTDSTGSSGTNANIQPYITVKMWKRTA